MQKDISKKGFTLVELLVSVALFSIVMMISIGSLLTLVDANRKVQALRVVTDNVAFAMDTMTRSIRTGYNYSCPASASSVNSANTEVGPDCSGGGDGIEFTNSDGTDRIGYKYDATLQAVLRSVDGSSWERITAPEARIEKLRFFVTGTTVNDAFQPIVTVILEGAAGTSSKASTLGSFNVQTTATQRVLDTIN
ncbi:type II secretion system GspH family protein [Patescibacteria group bacterium]|nr:type II secretion system GspH family protein [Patescibacteria group bacterium]